MIDGKKIFDQPRNSVHKTYGNIRKISTGTADDYTTGCLLDYCQMIVVDLLQMIAICYR